MIDICSIIMARRYLLHFTVQIVPIVPIEAHDIPVGKIITNKGSYSLHER